MEDKKKRCPNGTKKNKKIGKCEPKQKKQVKFGQISLIPNAPKSQQLIHPTKPKRLRPSPSQSAKLFNVGQCKKGNDGNMWQVKQNVNGVKRWVKYSKKTQ
jgi:hypothetical protein